MYTANVWFAALFIAGLLGALIAFQLLLRAVAPEWSARSVATLRTRPVASAFLGAAIAVVTVFVAALSGALGGPGKFVAGLLVTGMSFPMVMALGAVSTFVGERMPSRSDAGQPWRATLRGGVTCGLAFVTPVVGWFVVLPATIVCGLGAVALGVFAGSPARAAAPAAELQASPPPLPSRTEEAAGATA
jgi:hypothetical protein